ncbi:MAG TPA: AraD1 family protein [Terriglobales bacterium]
MTRLIQIRSGALRRVALVDEPRLRLLDGVDSIYALANAAITAGKTLSELAQAKLGGESLEYNAVYEGRSEWSIRPAIDHPEPARCLVSGTGLTHLGSARDRQAMHAKTGNPAENENPTDSMKMFRWGLDGGRPDAGCIGTPPEWFYKGTGAVLRGHGEALEVPAYTEDGGEEAEVAGIYVIDPDGRPRRIGMAIGNEFSDHCFEKKNYLNLAGSKLRNCALGPEVMVDPEFSSVAGEVKIRRQGSIVWSKPIRTGEAEMCHNLQNIEHHHFKFEQHRRPGDVHVHFFGADCLSFGDGIRLADGDWMEISFAGFGRALRNPVRIHQQTAALVSAIPLG